MRFVAIDVETANPRYHSICQIGVVLFEDGREVAAERVFVDPQEEFGDFQIRVHGIQPDHVIGSPCFRTHFPWLQTWTHESTVVSHSNFDRAAIGQACDRHSLPRLGCDWIDTVGVSMAAWPGLKSYKLRDLATKLQITYRAHDALEDARTCGLIFQHALANGAVAAPRVDGPTTRARGKWAAHVRRMGDGDGGLLGETIVFTGELSIPRDKAADMAAEAGANVIPNVTKKVTMLVVGERDLQPGWQAKSGKHRQTEALIGAGTDIRIVGEPDFLALAAIKD